MDQNPENRISLGSRLASYVAVERKKAITATCLVLIMGTMWVRLLTGHGEPPAAGAATVPALLQTQDTAPEISIAYKVLPFTAGRNDTLATDFFAPGDWTAFLSKDEQKPVVQTPAEEPRAKAIREIAAGLKLQITEMGTEPQAFISDSLVREASTITIVSGDDSFEFKVLRITRRTVQLQCEDMTFEVRLKDK
jgi:hypothetical protein